MRAASEELVARHSAYATISMRSISGRHLPATILMHLMSGLLTFRTAGRSIHPKRKPSIRLSWPSLLRSQHRGGPGAWVAPSCMFHGSRNSNVSEPSNIGWTWTPAHYGNGRWRPSPWGWACIHQIRVKLPGSPVGLRWMTSSSRKASCRPIMST